ncbi:HAAS signaling domain-containing protein [Streptomyces sioyaensis]|uniref:HAAS signaling domain-containing protein n=1 Tax=Streptomyces sioyaensis TaxID=67364 RepID=UPI003798E548
MSITEHPLVQNYLAAVAREAAGLSPERRNELLADLEEHIAVALAEEPASGDDGVRAVLARLGDPRTIAATALGEEPPAPQSPGLAVVRAVVRALAVLVLLGVASSLAISANPFIAAVPLIGALWCLWAGPQWCKRDKVIGTAAALAPLLFAVAQAVIAAAGLHFGLGDAFLPVGLAALALPTAAGCYLLWSAVRPLLGSTVRAA